MTAKTVKWCTLHPITWHYFASNQAMFKSRKDSLHTRHVEARFSSQTSKASCFARADVLKFLVRAPFTMVQWKKWKSVEGKSHRIPFRTQNKILKFHSFTTIMHALVQKMLGNSLARHFFLTGQPCISTQTLNGRQKIWPICKSFFFRYFCCESAVNQCGPQMENDGILRLFFSCFSGILVDLA